MTRSKSIYAAARRRALLRAAATLVGLALPLRATGADADPAVAPIRAFYDALLAAMKQAEQLGVRGRYDKLAPVIRATFDLPAMTRIAVGPEWTAIPPNSRRRCRRRFAHRTIATYANRFDGYSGESFEVDPEVLTRNNGRIVRTKIVRPKDEPVTLNYLMRGSGDTWKVVDIYLTGTDQRARDAALGIRCDPQIRRPCRADREPEPAGRQADEEA